MRGDEGGDFPHDLAHANAVLVGNTAGMNPVMVHPFIYPAHLCADEAIHGFIAVHLPHFRGIPLGDFNDVGRGDMILPRQQLLCQGDSVLRLREPADFRQADAFIHAGVDRLLKQVFVEEQVQLVVHEIHGSRPPLLRGQIPDQRLMAHVHITLHA